MANPVNSKWRIAAIVLAFVALGLGLELFRIKSALKMVFHYDVKVTVTDKNTGKILEGVTAHVPGTSSQDIFDQSTTFGGGIESRQFSGIAYEPRKFEFSAEGYKRKDVEVAADTKSSITVELEPKNQEAEQAGGGQHSTARKAKQEGNENLKPESEGRSR